MAVTPAGAFSSVHSTSPSNPSCERAATSKIADPPASASPTSGSTETWKNGAPPGASPNTT